MLLALQAPVAGDLRLIVSAIEMVADIDRMGALALHVAKIARRRHPQHALPEEVNGYFAEWAESQSIGQQRPRGGASVATRRKPPGSEKKTTPWTICTAHLFSVLMDREWKHGVAAAVDVTLLAVL